MERQKEFQKTYDDFQEGKKLSERYIALKRKLETCREVKNSAVDSLKDRRAVSYFETCQGQILSKLDQHEQSMKKMIEQMENTKRVLEEKLDFVKQRLVQAKERAEGQAHHKTKEEVTIEREIKDMIPKYSELVPNSDLNQVFPDYRKLLNIPEPTPAEPVYTAPTNIPKQTPSYPKAKRKAKTVDDAPSPAFVELYSEPKRETNPLSMMSDKDISKLSQAEVWSHLHPGKPNPFEGEEEEQEEQEEQEEEEEYRPPPRPKASLYGNVVQNSKVQRK
jgi:hypothetical protein